MGLFSKLFGKKEKPNNVRQRTDQPDVIDVPNQDEAMNWGMEKARLTIHYFEECLRNPKSSQQYFSVKIKIVDGNKVEHIWLNQPSFDEEGNLFGIVGNEPIDVRSVKLNQKIGIDKALISDWMIIENGRLIGGYTIRAVRDGLPESQLASFDQSLGGMRVDYGEDYFLANNETPEGAIIMIEEAYDEDNMEKAIACKDFSVEAQMMLKKIMKQDLELDNEIVHKTAEALQLSFIAHHQENGMPKFHGVKRAFPKREKISDRHFVITEICYFPDGTATQQKLNTYQTDDGWKVLAPEG